MDKRAYEKELVETWAIDGEEAEIFSVQACLGLELEAISYALNERPQGDEESHWLKRLHEFMVYTVSK